MRGLLFGVAPDPAADDLPAGVTAAERSLATTPMALQDLDDPILPADDWVTLRPRLTGICGSDAKQVFLEGDPDNAMTVIISFPQVLGHEVVADVVEVGPDAEMETGIRVLVDPWLTCVTRGLEPPCSACVTGQHNLCHDFAGGYLPPGIHSGTCSKATGGFAELMPAHTSMCIPVPDDVSDEAAVLADPFSVSLHAVLRAPPSEGSKVLVYGVGALGATTIAVLRTLYPDTEVTAIARFAAQREIATKFGAHSVLPHRPTEEIVRTVGDLTGGTVREPLLGLPWLHPGGVDIVYDTVGSPETLEVGVRIARPRGTIVVTGVSTPGRFEWTPWYFKELTITGSNAFGVEGLRGKRQHAMRHYLDLVREVGLDLRPLLTHTYRLEQWREAFGALADQGRSGAVKVAFDLR